jgi:hypothetical protein
MLFVQGGAIENLSARELDALRGRSMSIGADDVAALAAQIDAHLDRVRDALSRNEFLNLPLAERIAAVLSWLLGSYQDLGAHARPWVIGAARVFLETHDVLDDLASPIGFDDDARILNAVLRDIGREDLLIEL